jgi:hypothetical protein
MTDRAVIVIEGGLVREVITDRPLDVIICDYDIEGCEDEEISIIDHPYGRYEAKVYSIEESVDGEGIERFVKALR